jgi:hypothetical protein
MSLWFIIYKFFKFVFGFVQLFESKFDFPLHYAAGSQISPLYHAVGSKISPLHVAAEVKSSPLHDAAGSLVNDFVRNLPLHDAAASQISPLHFVAERCDKKY